MIETKEHEVVGLGTLMDVQTSHNISAQPQPEIIETQPDQYPDYYFDLRPGFFRSTGEGAPADDAPLRGTLRALADTLPETYGHLGDLKVRKNHIDRVKSYMGSSVIIDGKKMKRKESFDLDATSQELLSDLEKLNHPVVQVLRQVESEFKDHLTYRQLVELALQTVKYTNWNELKTALPRHRVDNPGL
jgi:hypothetical protein